MNTFTLGFDMAPLKKTFFFLFCYFLFSFSIILSITGIFIYNFEKISFYEYDILLKQRMSLAGQNNDIIIVGDSSGLNGLLANNIYNSTGLKTVNLSLYANNGTQSYEILLKNYIENNKIPKKVILYFSVISPNNWKTVTYEKSILILRYANLSQKLSSFFKTHTP